MSIFTYRFSVHLRVSIFQRIFPSNQIFLGYLLPFIYFIFLIFFTLVVYQLIDDIIHIKKGSMVVKSINMVNRYNDLQDSVDSSDEDQCHNLNSTCPQGLLECSISPGHCIYCQLDQTYIKGAERYEQQFIFSLDYALIFVKFQDFKAAHDQVVCCYHQ